jgi:4-amino-4-deoxy-L-arabinose transferase-like glycosyltransferase
MGGMSGQRWLLRDLAWLVALALLVRTLTALPMQRPGYMDASYYVDGALSLYEGRGFSDPFIWNYLDDPEGIPYPSHLYWMPLSSILAYWAFLLFGPMYRAAQIPFGLLSALLPALSYLVAYDVARSRRHAACAGLFTVFSAFYMAYWVTPDNFAPFAVAGAVCLWALGRGARSGKAVWFAVAGVGAGLAHLARADGVLLTAVALLACVLQITSQRLVTADQRPMEEPKDTTRSTDRASWVRRSALCYLLFAICYLLVMGPWFVRNWIAIGRPLATSGMQTVWLTDYNDLFSYAKPLDVRSYLAWGMGNILRSKLGGLWKNLGQLLLAGWMVFLAPFGLIGVWRLRCRVELLSAWVYGVALYLAMSLVFTFAGWRGGMLHSMVALLPSLYAAAMEGLDGFVAWMARRRRTWRVRQAQQVFGAAFVLFAVVLSLVLYVKALDKFTGTHPYSVVATWLSEHAPATTPVMVNDPATFYYYSRRPCLSIPNAGRETVLRVMDRYGASYLVLDENNPSLRDLYDAPRDDVRLALVETFFSGDSKTYLFRIGES